MFPVQEVSGGKRLVVDYRSARKGSPVQADKVGPSGFAKRHLEGWDVSWPKAAGDILGCGLSRPTLGLSGWHGNGGWRGVCNCIQSGWQDWWDIWWWQDLQLLLMVPLVYSLCWRSVGSSF